MHIALDTTCSRLLAAGCLLFAAGPLDAQRTATLSGVVTDRSTGRGIPSASVVFLAESLSVATDSAGRFVLQGLPLGALRMLARAPGFPAKHFGVELLPDVTIQYGIELDSTAFGRLAAAQALPEVAVSAPAPVVNYRLASFERRRLHGRGQYLTEDEIVKSGAYNVADAVKHMRGVTYECGGGSGCHIRMARAPMRCRPEFIVDDQVMNDFGPLTPIRDIIALELYTGPAEVPGEYAGRNAGCGVVVIWTRSGPTRRAQPQRPPA